MEEDVILNKIIEEAEKEAKSIISEAEDTAKKIELANLEKSRKQAEEQFVEIKIKIDREISIEKDKVDFESRKAILIEKKKLIEIVKEKVKQKIKDLTDNEYINIIDEKIKKYSNEKNVEILLPSKCYLQIKKIATDYGMNVLEETDEFESGVIIKCGDIEYNYDFEENMNFMNEEIEKEIDTILFKI